MDGYTRVLGIVICALAFFQVKPVVVQTWRVSGEEIVPWKSEEPPRLEINPYEADLDDDGILERVTQVGTRAMITKPCKVRKYAPACIDEEVWSSPPSWQVRQVTITELNHDRRPEVTLLIWRPFEPWPIDRYIPHGGRIEGFHNRAGLSNHLILVGWKQGSWRELWAGSALVRPLLTFSTGDVNGDGFAELVAIESSYEAAQTAAGNRLSVWEWNGFGFTRLGRVVGNFQEVDVAHTEKNGYIILTQN